MNRPLRIVVATASLAVAGALLGAVAGAVALAVGAAITEHHVIFAEALEMAALYGAALGAVAAPAAGWLLLRRVPLGLAAGGAVLGTVVGGAAGWAVSSLGRFNSISAGLLGALIGFVAAAVALRLTVGRTPARVSTGGEA